MKPYNFRIKIQLHINNLIMFSFMRNMSDKSIELNGTSIKAKHILVDPADENIRTDQTDQITKSKLQLISFEKSLRESAYQFSFKEKFDKEFFDNSDMTGSYYLHVIYDSITNTPLMSARSYATIKDIIEELGGRGKELLIYNHGTGKRKLVGVDSIIDSEDNSSFVVDRVSQQFRNSPRVKRYRNLIYCLLFRSLYCAHKGSRHVYSIVRVDDSELLLSRYIELGLNIIGMTNYKVGSADRKHWILKGDVIKIKNELPLKIQSLKEIYR